MSDPSTVLVENLHEALRQINTYLALGITSALSALVLDLQLPTSKAREPVAVVGALVPVRPEVAKWILLGVCFVVGALASYAAESALATAKLLRPSAELFAAACTFPSVVTAPPGFRLLAAAAPVIFVAPIMWRGWSRVRATKPEEGWGGLIATLGFVIAPYGAFALTISRLPCSH